jgi:hypothetical protein
MEVVGSPKSRERGLGWDGWWQSPRRVEGMCGLSTDRQRIVNGWVIGWLIRKIFEKTKCATTI